VVRADDIAWFNIVKWVAHGLVNAEELGISTATADEAMRSAKPNVRRFVGAEGDLGVNQLWSMGGILYAPPLR
jgi:general L-amino acid transport system substrate-binding protein